MHRHKNIRRHSAYFLLVLQHLVTQGPSDIIGMSSNVSSLLCAKKIGFLSANSCVENKYSKAFSKYRHENGLTRTVFNCFMAWDLESSLRCFKGSKSSSHDAVSILLSRLWQCLRKKDFCRKWLPSFFAIISRRHAPARKIINCRKMSKSRNGFIR